METITTKNTVSLIAGKISSQLLTSNIAKLVKDYLFNIMESKLKLAQIFLLDTQELENHDEFYSKEFIALKNKIEIIFKNYRIEIKPKLREQFNQIIIFFNTFISYSTFLKEDLNYLNTDTSLNSYKAPLVLLMKHAEENLNANLKFIEELNKEILQLTLIYLDVEKLAEQLTKNINFDKKNIDKLKIEINSLKTEVDEYNQALLRAHFSNNNASTLMFNSESIANDNEINNHYTNATANSKKSLDPSIAFSIAQYEDKLAELAADLPIVKTVFSLSQFIQDWSSNLSNLSNLIMEINKFWNTLIENISQFELFIDNNKQNSNAIDEALQYIDDTTINFQELISFSITLYNKTIVEIPDYLTHPSKLKLAFLLNDPKTNLASLRSYV